MIKGSALACLRLVLFRHRFVHLAPEVSAFRVEDVAVECQAFVAHNAADIAEKMRRRADTAGNRLAKKTHADLLQHVRRIKNGPQAVRHAARNQRTEMDAVHVENQPEACVQVLLFREPAK
jgi:hypothetical protein